MERGADSRVLHDRSDVAAANVGFGVGYGEAAAIFTTFPASYFGQIVDNTTILFVSFTACTTFDGKFYNGDQIDLRTI